LERSKWDRSNDEGCQHSRQEVTCPVGTLTAGTYGWSACLGTRTSSASLQRQADTLKKQADSLKKQQQQAEEEKRQTEAEAGAHRHGDQGRR
jgi:hypothetical protein